MFVYLRFIFQYLYRLRAVLHSRKWKNKLENHQSSKQQKLKLTNVKVIKICLLKTFSDEFLFLWCRGVVVFTTAQLYSTKPQLRFCAVSNPARSISGIRDGEDLWQWSQLEIRVNVFHWSTIPQKQFIIKFII